MIRPTTEGVQAAVRALGDFAVWPGLYAIGCLWLYAWLVDANPPGEAATFVFLTSQGAYLLDRVKVRRSGLDPADQVANPARYRAIAKQEMSVRWVAFAEIAGASVVGWTIAGRMAAVPILAGLGVWWYAGRPAGIGPPRPKDWPVSKAGLVAAGHTALAVVSVGGARHLGQAETRASLIWALAGLGLGALVASDAVLCDLDDLSADRAFHTRTLPVQFGSSTAWTAAASSAGLAAGVGVALRPIGQAGLFFALVAVSLAIAAWLDRKKDFIDARMLLVGAVCLLAAR